MRIKGIVYLDLALSIALAGAFVSFYFIINLTTKSNIRKSIEESTIHAIQNSIEAYAFTHSRLPCPSQDNNGIALSNCDVIREGYIPYRTLGIYDDAAKAIRYKLSVPSEDKKLDLAKEKMNSFKIAFIQDGQPSRNLLVSDYSIAKDLINENDHFLDFCVALGDTSDDKNNSNAVAYTLFKTNTLNPIFTSTIYEKLKSNLFNNFNCERLISASARTHINIASAFELMRQSTEDGSTLNKINQKKAIVKLASYQLKLFRESVLFPKSLVDMYLAILNLRSFSTSSTFEKVGQILSLIAQSALIPWHLGQLEYAKYQTENYKSILANLEQYDRSYEKFLTDLKDKNLKVAENAFRSIYSGLSLPKDN